MKLLQVEFTINPSENDSGYRLQMISQSVEIKYHTVQISLKSNPSLSFLLSQQSTN